MDTDKMPLGEHLEDLRRRLIYALIALAVGMGAGLIFGRWIIELLKWPYAVAMQRAELEANLAVLTATGGLTAYLKVSLLAGLILAAPWIVYQFWMFVSAGLYPRERRYVHLAVPFSAALFVGGAVFFLAVVAAPSLYFLITFSKWLGVEAVITLQSHISFMVSLAVVTGLGFQTPLVILILAKMRLVSQTSLRRYRKHVIVAILALAAIFTPPDIFTQLALGLPM
ncbi:MAG: twin-arginine translocase subunit TatC [Phycisphaerae bacterium]|nr:twin-arginine translocase subunit TatC [Phycisphaerae bacterium]